MRPFGLQPLNDLQEVRERTGQSVDPHHHQSIASPQLIQHARQNRPGATAARGLLLDDFHAACGAQLLNLGQGGLIFCGNTRVSDEWHGAGGLFAIADIKSKRPFKNECKDALCGLGRQKPFGFFMSSVIER